MVISFVTNPSSGGNPAKDRICIVKSDILPLRGKVCTVLVLL
jgi:hypothetical protein